VLVGLMGAGKSSVGRRLAALCGREFVDLDEEIRRVAGRGIGELFAERGEAGFRAREAAATLALAARIRDSRSRLVIAAGGGWMANREARTALPDAETVWLKVDPVEAARRLAGSDATRPLLDGYDPADRLTKLLAERLPAYGQATYTVDTNGRDAGTVARELAAVAGIPIESAQNSDPNTES
jgi:shikimate kinase